MKGHLALLLGLLCNSTSDCLDVLAYLSGSSDQSKLSQLVETIQDFSAAYRNFSKHLTGESTKREAGDELQGESAESKVETVPNSPPRGPSRSDDGECFEVPPRVRT